MRSTGWAWGGAVVLAVAVAAACSGGGSSGGSGGAGGPPPPGVDGGGGGGQPDAGPGGGQPDAGSGGGTDAGATGPADGGAPANPGVTNVPTLPGWTFYAASSGMPGGDVHGASIDEGGNLWVAGGQSGVFVLRADSSGQLPTSGSFQRFGLADGLHPYGYLNGDVAKQFGVPDGSPADANPVLNAISIAGGRAGVAFVGYRGRLDPRVPSDGIPAGHVGCEDEWDYQYNQGKTPDPAIYKSGDADKVTLASSGGISVAHYDVFSGPNVVAAEPRGREKLCTIYRIKVEHGTNNVWFGGNHGFAWGHADFDGNPNCNGQLSCAGVWEHVHPAIGGSLPGEILTADYFGIALDPVSAHDVWFGGLIRSTRFKFGSLGGYFQAQTDTEASDNHNKIDVWPDAVPEYPTPAQRVDDAVSGIAALPNGDVLIGSFNWGLKRVAHDGTVGADYTNKLLNQHLSSLVSDPADGSIWVGYNREGGSISRLHFDSSGNLSSVDHFYQSMGPIQLSAVVDLQAVPATGSSPRRIIASFADGAVGVYSGN